MPIHSLDSPGPFEALDADWALICRRRHRSEILDRWAAQEPALVGIGDLDALVPAPGVDRGPITCAVDRLHVLGDDLAGRALLQLLVPGMIRMAAAWRHRLDATVGETGWEIIGRAAIYVGLLRERDIRCAPAGYVLSSVHRDLALEAIERQHEPAVRGDRPGGRESQRDPRLSVPSAEDTVCATTGIRDALEAAVTAGVLPAESLDVLLLVLSGYSMAEATELTRTPYSTQASYRHRATTYAYLYRQLFAAGREGAGR